MEIIILILTVLLIIVGLVGTILPALPGTPIIFLGMLLYVLYHGFSDISVTLFILLGVIAVLAQLFDYLAGAYGAKKLGSTKYGMWGAIIGGIVGVVMLNIVGLVTGVFLGAALAELVFAKKNASESIKIGFGSVLGFLGGTIIKILLGLMMTGMFLFAILT